ncbi:MAG: hypothetical protein LBB61_02430 [Treponema sp.]|nr:hypothetical protein [Treponema sp.]
MILPSLIIGLPSRPFKRGRSFYRRFIEHPAVTPEQLMDAGFQPPAPRTPDVAPAACPEAEADGSVSRQLAIRFRDRGPWAGGSRTRRMERKSAGPYLTMIPRTKTSLRPAASTRQAPLRSRLARANGGSASISCCAAKAIPA